MTKYGKDSGRFLEGKVQGEKGTDRFHSMKWEVSAEGFNKKIHGGGIQAAGFIAGRQKGSGGCRLAGGGLMF